MSFRHRATSELPNYYSASFQNKKSLVLNTRDIYSPVIFENILRIYDDKPKLPKKKSKALNQLYPKKQNPFKAYNYNKNSQSQKEFYDFEQSIEKQNKENINTSNLNYNGFDKKINTKTRKFSNTLIISNQEQKMDIEIPEKNQFFQYNDSKYYMFPFHSSVSEIDIQPHDDDSDSLSSDFKFPNSSYALQTSTKNENIELKSEKTFKTIENKLSKGYSLKKIAKQLLHYKHFQLNKLNNSLNRQELLELAMLFLQNNFVHV